MPRTTYRPDDWQSPREPPGPTCCALLPFAEQRGNRLDGSGTRPPSRGVVYPSTYGSASLCRMIGAPPEYEHAVASGVYLPGVDTSHVAGRHAVEWPSGPKPRQWILLILGQSNAANHGDTRFAGGPGACNFNLFDGRCYQATDPLLGATGDGGSPWCLLADELIRRGAASQVLLVPIAVGGSSVGEWAPGGTYQNRLGYALDRLGERGILPTHVLWHQGEADALYGTSAHDYAARFRSLVQSLRGRGVMAPIYVAGASYFSVPEGYSGQQQVVRSAQCGLIDPAAGIFEGPDTDSILERYDGCHMNAAGLRRHAAVWRDLLISTTRA